MSKVAYFCMEYGLDPALDIYAGGLGVLAGDFLKAAHDLKEDLIGVGILWTEGYAEQVIEGGKPIDKFQHYNYDFLEDTDISFRLNIDEEKIKCKVYKTEEFNNNPLYLLDTSLPENSKEMGKITARLYSEDPKLSLLQRLVLGRGGVKLLSELDFKPEIHHLNESDSVFAGLELLKQRLKDENLDNALEKVKKKVRFTTHTPVKTGNPEHDYELLEEVGFLEDFSREELEKLGGQPFNLTLAALRLAGKANAVSQRHKKIAKDMWSKYGDVPKIRGITNGVHFPTWQSDKIRDAGSRKELWKMHQLEKERLIEDLDPEFKPGKPLFGFARRFPQYKRPELFFWDEKKAEELLKDVNIVFSGKAHPANKRGKELISEIVGYAKKYEGVTWIEDYEMDDAKKLVKGCDVWLSCPVPTREACSTSVIKAASNAIPNCSTLDGWWWEACEHGVNGWQFGDSEVKQSRDEQDEHDAKALYRVLKNEIIPAYNDRDKWAKMMENSIKTAEKYTAAKMFENYKRKLW